jgi:hypothetical protein
VDCFGENSVDSSCIVICERTSSKSSNFKNLTMKLLSTAVLRITLLFMMSTCTLVNSERVIRFLFNNGVALPNNEKCTAADNVFLYQIFNITAPVRNLRGGGGKSIVEAGNQHRVLFPPKCRKDCERWEDGRCLATDCKGYRRRVMEQGNGQHRELQAANTTCAEDINDFNSQLDALVSNNIVSSDCQAVLNAPRMPLCYDDIMYGVVESITLWNGDTNSIIQTNVQDGVEVCKSIGINFELKANPCVNLIRYNVTGEMGFKYFANEKKPGPYFVFKANYTQGPGEVYGRRQMRNGTYTLTATPDDIKTKAKMLKFHLLNC